MNGHRTSFHIVIRCEDAPGGCEINGGYHTGYLLTKFGDRVVFPKLFNYQKSIVMKGLDLFCRQI